LETRRECHQSSNGFTGARTLNITKAERIEEMVLIHVWPSGIKPFQIQTHIFRQGLLLTDKMTVFTGSNCPLIFKDDSFNFLKQ
jgi:hypothetical protein